VQQPAGEVVDQCLVLGVHVDHEAGVCCRLQDPQNVTVADRHAGVGREDLDAGKAVGGKRRQFFQRTRCVRVDHGDVEPVVDQGTAVGFRLLPVDRGGQPGAVILEREVDVGRYPARGRGPGSGLVIVGGRLVPGLGVEVGVDVDGARRDHQAAGVDHAACVPAQRWFDRGDAAIGDADISVERPLGGGERPAADNAVE
jgi:hypothetical protein